MAGYKLYYFNGRARAEDIRWMLCLGGVEFEDIRFQMEEWPTKKPEMPFGYVPVLEVGGQRLSESQAIGRYLANKFSLAGKSDWDKALADQYVDIVYDLLAEARAIAVAPNDQSREEIKKNLFQEKGPRILKFFETCLESNPSGYLVGDSLTWADVFVASYLDSFIDRLSPGFGVMLDKFPRVRAHLERVRAEPKIAAFIAKRAYTPF